MTPYLAFDRMGSVRTFDEDGRLHIDATPISKANICSYLGREIPGCDALGLQPDKQYRLYRDAEALKQAAPSFNRLPILEEHQPVTADEPRRELVIGATGEAAAFDAPFLTNSMVVWDGNAIERIKTGAQREISSAYAYEPDMTPGEIDGEAYDGRMIKIRGNHIALVEQGRAGPDVMVADSADKSGREPKMAENETDIDENKERQASDGLEDGLRALLGETVPSETVDAILKLVNGIDTPPAVQDTDEDPETPSEPTIAVSPAEGSETSFSREDVNRIVEDKLRAHDAKRRAMDTALKDVHPLVGDVIGMDSAEAIYNYTLKQVGVDTTGINTAGMKALVASQIQARRSHVPDFAMDHATHDFGVPAPRKY